VKRAAALVVLLSVAGCATAPDPGELRVYRYKEPPRYSKKIWNAVATYRITPYRGTKAAEKKAFLALRHEAWIKGGDGYIITRIRESSDIVMFEADVIRLPGSNTQVQTPGDK
jgi:hypothetical protein